MPSNYVNIAKLKSRDLKGAFFLSNSINGPKALPRRFRKYKLEVFNKADRYYII